jgi:hypothetical protein
MSDCVGRIGAIAATVRDLFNESVGGFLPDEFIIRSINHCQRDLAQENYWRRYSWIPSTAGAAEVDLLTHVSGYQDIHQVAYSGQGAPMKPLSSFTEYHSLTVDAGASGIPQYYVVQNNTMYVWPVPSAPTESGYRVYHSYAPEELTCDSGNPNPAIPEAHDMIFVYYVLQHAYLRDRHAPGAAGKVQEYAALYDREKRKLQAAGDPPTLSLRAGRP